MESNKSGKLRLLIKKTGVNPFNLFFASLLSLATAACEGVAIWALIPLVKGIIEMDFGFIRQSAGFNNPVTDLFPAGFFSNKNIFIMLVSIIFVSSISKQIIQYFGSLIVALQIRRSSNNLMKLIFARYLSFGKVFFDNHNAGYLHNLLLNFTMVITGQIKVVEQMMNSFFILILYLIFMFRISWKLALFAIILLPILNFSLSWLVEKLKRSSELWAESYGAISSNVSNMLSCIPLVKLYTAEEREKKRFRHMSDRIEKVLFSIDKKQNLVQPLQEIIVLIAMVLLLSVIALVVLKRKSVELSSMVIFFYILKRAQSNLGVFNNIKTSFASVDGPIQEVLRVFDDSDKVFVPDGDKKFPGLKRSIDFNKLNFSYRKDLPTLNDLTFDIKKGATTAVVGPTGAGKTTIISLLLRFYDAAPGSITIDGNDIRDFTIESLRAHMALVSQDALLFNDSLRNNIIYGLKEEVSDERLINVSKKAKLYDFIMTLPEKFDTRIGDKGVLLSGGEKQRVAIARALLKNAEILILDEATSSLDTKTEKLIQEAIDEAVRDKTAIVIAHRLSTIKNADKIIVVDEGRIAEQGKLNELLDKKGKFHDYWHEQKFF